MATHADASKMGKDAFDSTRAEDLDRKKASGTRSTGFQEKSQRGKKDTSGRPDTKDASRQTSNTGKRNSSMRVANILILPPELLTQIFQFLSLSDRLHFRFVRYIGIQYLASSGFWLRYPRPSLRLIKGTVSCDRFRQC
jgi:hypothetical protein